jgi:hypothetical protein
VARYQRAATQWKASALFGAEAAILLAQIRSDLTSAG